MHFKMRLCTTEADSSVTQELDINLFSSAVLRSIFCCTSLWVSWVLLFSVEYLL